MVFNFTATPNSLIVILDTEEGAYAEQSTTYFSPSFRFANNLIKLYESGTYKDAFSFDHIGVIQGQIPTDLNDAFVKLYTLIENFSSGGVSPLPIITNLKPIVIYDPFGEYFTDSASALVTLTKFGFPTPTDSFYNTNSKEFYFWFDRNYLENIFVLLHSDTGLSFGLNNHVSIQDESGFIYNFTGNAFYNNTKDEYSKPNKLKVLSTQEVDILTNLRNDIEIEKCYVNVDNFCNYAVANIHIKFGSFYGNNAFIQYSYTGNSGNVLEIDWLDYIGGSGFCELFGGKIVIKDINRSLLSSYSDNMFYAEIPAILHLPFYAKGTIFGNYAQKKISEFVKTNRVVYDGLTDRLLEFYPIQFNASILTLNFRSEHTYSDVSDNIRNNIGKYELAFSQPIFSPITSSKAELKTLTDVNGIIQGSWLYIIQDEYTLILKSFSDVSGTAADDIFDGTILVSIPI